MAKYLYPDLKYDDYKSLHHTKKISLLKEIISYRLLFKNEYLSVSSRLLFYILEGQNFTLLTIQKKRYLESDFFFDKSLSLRELRSRLGYYKKNHIKLQKRKANKTHKKEGKKGVYVLLDAEHKKKLSVLLKAKKTTITAMFIDLIDSETVKIFNHD